MNESVRVRERESDLGTEKEEKGREEEREGEREMPTQSRVRNKYCLISMFLKLFIKTTRLVRYCDAEHGRYENFRIYKTGDNAIIIFEYLMLLFHWKY